MRILAIHLDGQVLKGAVVQCQKKSFEVKKIFSHSLVQKEDKWISQEIQKEIERDGASLDLVSAIASEFILMRHFDLPIRKRKTLHAMLPFQIESHLPYPAESAINLSFIKKEKRQTRITILSCLKSRIEAHLESLKQWGVEPGWVSSESQALFRFAKWRYPEADALLHIHFAQDKTLLQLYCGGIIEKKSVIDIGKKGLTSQESSFYQQFDQILYTFFSNKNLLRETDHLLISGEAVSLPSLAQWIHKALGKTLHPLEEGSLSKEASAYALPIGLCLDIGKKDHQTVQFRSGSYFPAILKKRLYKTFVFYTAAMVAFTLSILSAVIQYSNRQKRLFLSEFESFYQTLPKENALSLNLKPGLSAKKILGTIENASATLIDRHEMEFGYIRQHPYRASAFLEWLSKEKEKIQSLEIYDFNYTLASFPTQEKPKAPYRVKIELRFKTGSQDEAQKFQSILKKNISLDTKDFYWSREENGYKTTFFLKNSKA